MTLECRVVSVHLADDYTDNQEQIVVKIGTDFHNSLTLINDEALKLGDRFVLVSQPCAPKDIKEM